METYLLLTSITAEQRGFQGLQRKTRGIKMKKSLFLEQK